MRTIKDRIFLGLIAGMAGNVVKTVVDEISLRMKFSQRSFRATAAGAWVNQKSEAENLQGQILGSFLDFGLAGLGGIAITETLAKTSKEHLTTKGIMSGITIGSFITFVLSVLPENKVAPKDAASNLSYMLSHAFYGLTAISIIAKFGDPALFGIESHRKVPQVHPASDEKESSCLPQSQPSYP